MDHTSTAPRREASSEPRSSGGLRLRIWIACLAGAIVAGGGIWWVVGTQLGVEPSLDLAVVVSWLGAVAGLGVIVAAAFALWLDHGLVAHTRGLTQALATRQIARLRGLPAASGWGELSQLTQQIQHLVTHYRSAERAAEELGLVRDQLRSLHEALERWNDTERWKDPKREPGPVGGLVDSLGRGLGRLDEWREQNLEVARQIARELELALDAARESSEQAERGFVEATALMTTVRELQRLHGELQQAWMALPATAAEATRAARPMELAREAIEELVVGSTEAVERLARGMRRAEEMGDQTALLANRATLVALESVLGARSPESAEETRRLVDEIRATVDRASGLTRELADDVDGATGRMHELREQVSRKLESLPPPVEAPLRGREDLDRLLERVREMVQDATAKGERVSAAGERASRAADSLLRALESERREMEGLLVRLAPVTAESAAGDAQGEEPPPRPNGGLRLLGENDLGPEPDEPGAMPEAGEEPR